MDWIILTFILMILSLGGITVFYMIARAFKINELERWCKSEYMEILISAFIIIGIIVFIQGMIAVTFEVTELFTPGTTTPVIVGADPANIAIGEIYNLLEPVKKTYNNFIITNYVFTFATRGISIMRYDGAVLMKQIPVIGWIAASFSDAIGGLMQWIISILGLFITYMYFVIELIKFGDYIALLLLPSGIVLRAFPPTRGAGAMFIAMGLGFGIVLPSSFLMVLYASGANSGQISAFQPQTIEEYNELLEELCLDSGMGTSGILLNMGLSLDYANLLHMFIEGGFFAIMMKVFITPVIALVITYTFIRSFAMMLGADLAEIGRGIIKLI